MCRNIFAAVVVFMAITTSANARDWIELKSENFIVYSDAKEKTARELVNDLERFRYYLAMLTGIKPEQDYVPLKVYLLKSMSAYKSLTGSKNSAGKYVTSNDGPVAVAFAGKKRWKFGLTARQVIFHEYVHYFMFRNSPQRYPLWYQEGFADFMGGFKYKDGSFEVGGIVNNRLVSLYERKWAPFEDIVKAKTKRLSGRSKSVSTHLIYSQGWLLTHYLHFNDKYSQKLPFFLNDLRVGRDPVEAIEANFGESILDIEKGIKAMWKSRKMSYKRYLNADFVPAKAAYRKLNMREGKLVELQIGVYFNSSKNHDEDVLDDLNKAVKKDPENADLIALRALWIAKHLGNDHALASINNIAHHVTEKQPVRRAKSLIEVYKAINLSGSETRDQTEPNNTVQVVSDVDTNALVKARKSLFKALKEDKFDVEARFALALTYLHQLDYHEFSDKRKNAIVSHLDAASVFAPQREDIAYWLGMSLIADNRIEEACYVLKPIILSSMSPRQGNDIIRRMGKDPKKELDCAA